MENKIYQLYLELFEKHGSPEKYWPRWCAKRKSLADREKIAIGAILTQRTSWHNAHLALLGLRKANLLSLEKIANLPDLKKLTGLIKPAGFYQSKPKRLFNFSAFVFWEYKGLKNFMKEDLPVARRKLLSISGIGPETADTILLYALDKPTFVIDEYTKRLVGKKKLVKSLKSLTYDFLKDFFQKNLPKDVRIYQDFHALIIIDQKGEEESKMERF